MSSEKEEVPKVFEAYSTVLDCNISVSVLTGKKREDSVFIFSLYTKAEVRARPYQLGKYCTFVKAMDNQKLNLTDDMITSFESAFLLIEQQIKAELPFVN